MGGSASSVSEPPERECVDEEVCRDFRSLHLVLGLVLPFVSVRPIADCFDENPLRLVFRLDIEPLPLHLTTNGLRAEAHQEIAKVDVVDEFFARENETKLYGANRPGLLRMAETVHETGRGARAISAKNNPRSLALRFGADSLELVALKLLGDQNGTDLLFRPALRPKCDTDHNDRPRSDLSNRIGYRRGRAARRARAHFAASANNSRSADLAVIGVGLPATVEGTGLARRYLSERRLESLRLPIGGGEKEDIA